MRTSQDRLHSLSPDYLWSQYEETEKDDEDTEANYSKYAC
ncbi:hypothetical protein HTIA_p3048 (plasmid) [Halorhabdus tiamatea SARL4B]|uniref:Uncharacterized protein n=1 Tax=Halorhabdus tiamatea SARL4B TaxID=1033806 RepID=S6D4J0_9EURY|nr:hypothetical protein HTIA_p3048 [Halorhabdus tiamatea SARL4B]